MAGGGSRMKKSCACCKRYLEHLGGKMSCFLIRMTTDSMHSMIIPDRFVNHFGGKIPGTIKLESPNGILYVVEVTECMNKTVLQCGWEAFVDAHHIKVGDSLLFRHIENSCFEVMILDSDGSENVSLKSNRNGVSDESQESEDSEGPAGPPYILSWKSKSRLSSLQKKIIKEKVRSIQSEVPIYVAIMNKSNIGLTSSPCQLELGARYAAAVHLPDRRQAVVLQRGAAMGHRDADQERQMHHQAVPDQWLEQVR
ncbi:Os03g0619850, partial [Oryza sativa Japonica Group]